MNNKKNEENLIFELDDQTKKYLNANIIIALFKILHKQNKISKVELESLVSNVNRTFNKNREKV